MSTDNTPPGKEHTPDGPIERALARLGRIVFKHAGLILGLLLLSLVPAGWLASQLEVRASFLDLLPEQEAPVQQLHEVLGHARSASDIAIAVSTEDRAMAERFGEALVEALEHEEGVAGVGGHIDTNWFRERRLLFLPEDEFERLNARVEQTIDHELLVQSGLYIDFEEEPSSESTASLLPGGAASTFKPNSISAMLLLKQVNVGGSTRTVIGRALRTSVTTFRPNAVRDATSVP